MGFIVYSKQATYTQPAWTQTSEFIDGIYVDGPFFNHNVPIIRGVLGITIQPSKHFRQRNLTIATLKFQNGKVVPEIRVESWWLNEYDEHYIYIDYGGAFYGMGLNVIYLVSGVDLMTSAPVIYEVEYNLGVYY